MDLSNYFCPQPSRDHYLFANLTSFMIEDAKLSTLDYPLFWVILHHFQTTLIEHPAISVSSCNLDYFSSETIHLFDLQPQSIPVAEFSFEIDYLNSG